MSTEHELNTNLDYLIKLSFLINLKSKNRLMCSFLDLCDQFQHCLRLNFMLILFCIFIEQVEGGHGLFRSSININPQLFCR